MGDCSCVYLNIDDGLPSAFTARIVKARKAHKCVECGEVIFPGTRYERASGIWDGEPLRFHTCLDCISVRSAFFCSSHEYSSMWDELREHLRGLDGAVPSDCIAKVSPKAREKICNYIESVWSKKEE